MKDRLVLKATKIFFKESLTLSFFSIYSSRLTLKSFLLFSFLLFFAKIVNSSSVNGHSFLRDTLPGYLNFGIFRISTAIGHDMYEKNKGQVFILK